MSTSTKSPKTLSSPSAENKSTSTTATTSDTQSSPALLEVIEQQEHAGKLFVKSGRIKRTLVRKPRLSLRDLLSARRDAGSVRSQTSSVAQKLRKKDLEITKLKAIKEPKTLQALVEIICEKQPHKEIKRDALARELQAQVRCNGIHVSDGRCIIPFNSTYLIEHLLTLSTLTAGTPLRAILGAQTSLEDHQVFVIYGHQHSR